MTGDPDDIDPQTHSLALPLPDPSKERRSGPLQLLSLALLLAALVLPLAHCVGFWPQHLDLCITAPDGARVRSFGDRPVDAAVPAQLRHRIAWRVDDTEWICSVCIDHREGVANGRLRGHNRGGYRFSHLAPIEHVESCDGSLWLQPEARRIEVLPPRAGHCWLSCELAEERELTHAGAKAPPTRHWHDAVPAGAAPHQLGTDRWSLTLEATEGTCVRIVEVLAEAPFVQVVDDDSGFVSAELRRGDGPPAKCSPELRHPCGDEPLAVAFEDGEGIATTRLVLRLVAGAGLGLIVRASRPH